MAPPLLECSLAISLLLCLSHSSRLYPVLLSFLSLQQASRLLLNDYDARISLFLFPVMSLFFLKHFLGWFDSQRIIVLSSIFHGILSCVGQDPLRYVPEVVPQLPFLKGITLRIWVIRIFLRVLSLLSPLVPSIVPLPEDIHLKFSLSRSSLHHPFELKHPMLPSLVSEPETRTWSLPVLAQTDFFKPT